MNTITKYCSQSQNGNDESRRSFIKLLSLASLGAFSGFSFLHGEARPSAFLHRILLNSLITDAAKIETTLRPESNIAKVLKSGGEYVYAGAIMDHKFEKSQLSSSFKVAIQKNQFNKAALYSGMYIGKYVVQNNLKEQEIVNFIILRYKLNLKNISEAEMAKFFEMAWWRSLIKQHTIIPEETNTDEWIGNLYQMQEGIKSDSKKVALLLTNAWKSNKASQEKLFNTSDYKILVNLQKISDLKSSSNLYMIYLDNILSYFEEKNFQS